MTRHFILPAALLALSATPSLAQQEDGPSLMERGAQLFFEGLMQEVEPALKDFEKLAREFGPAFQAFAAEMGPALTAILEQVEDWSAYHPPEILPNGDIVIRRKQDRPFVPRNDGAEIEL